MFAMGAEKLRRITDSFSNSDIIRPALQIGAFFMAAFSLPLFPSSLLNGKGTIGFFLSELWI